MKFKLEDVLTIKGEKYTVLNSILYEGKDYIFTNKVKNDEPSDIFMAFEVVDGGVCEVKNEKILERILPIFSNNVQKIINKMKTEEKFNIGQEN